MKKEGEKTSRIVAAERIIIVEYFHPRVRMQRENDRCGPRQGGKLNFKYGRENLCPVRISLSDNISFYEWSMFTHRNIITSRTMPTLPFLLDN